VLYRVFIFEDGAHGDKEYITICANCLAGRDKLKTKNDKGVERNFVLA